MENIDKKSNLASHLSVMTMRKDKQQFLYQVFKINIILERNNKCYKNDSIK